MQGYRDDGVVLRTQKLGEADRIITLLTRQNGRVRAVAKGVRRTKSRFGARLEPFTHVDVLVYPGRSLDMITQAEVVRAYGTPLATDYPRYTAGTAMLETAERFTPVEKEPAIRQFLLLIGGLRALGEAVEPGGAAEPDEAVDPEEPDEAGEPGGAVEPDEAGEPDGAVEPEEPDEADEFDAVTDQRGSAEDARLARATEDAHDGRQVEPAPQYREPRLVLDAYLLRSLSLEGYAPALGECARCGAPGTPGAPGSHGALASQANGTRAPLDEVGASHVSPGARPLVAFAIPAGGMVCANCRPPGSASPAPQTVALMLALLRGDWVAAMRSERRHRVECSGLVAAYLQWHLEHSIRSLRHVERA